MKKILSFLLVLLVSTVITQAQDLDNPGEYMSAMYKTHQEMDQKYMAYTSATAHGKRARKVEKLRLQVLETIEKTKDKIMDLPFYKGDKSLRQSNIDYVDFCYQIFNEDYKKIVNEEEIAEQSFDEMQAHILFREKVDEKLKQANDNVNKASKDFAAKYKVNLIAGGKDDLGEKMEQANKVSKYYKPVYLIFFKCNWQNNAVTKALNLKKINDAEQARMSVIKYANEGLIELEKVVAFEGDGSVKMACRQALQGFKSLAENENAKATDFILKSESFEKLKKAMDAKDASERTKDDVDNFNKAVKEYNAAVNLSNQLGVNANTKQNDILKNWEETVAAFFDTHTPKYR